MLRRLSLHASALSDSEYQLYTTSLLSIVSVEDDGGVSQSQSHNMDDAYYENMNINVRETRAWLRGRYSHLPSLIIDKVSPWFIPPHPSTNAKISDSEIILSKSQCKRFSLWRRVLRCSETDNSR